MSVVVKSYCRVEGTFKRQGHIWYRCSRCGQEHWKEYLLLSEQSESYPQHENSAERQQKAKLKMAIRAIREIDAQDTALIESVNFHRDYEAVTQEVFCPRCQQLQPWSKIPCRWRKVKHHTLWVVGLVFAVFYTLLGIGMASDDVSLLPVFAVACSCLMFLILLPILRNFKRNKALKKARTADFVPPVYYSYQTDKTDANELDTNSMQQLKNGVVAGYCEQCGRSYFFPKDKKPICPECGAVLLQTDDKSRA